jgi:hypothetical protein
MERACGIALFPGEQGGFVQRTLFRATAVGVAAFLASDGHGGGQERADAPDTLQELLAVRICSELPFHRVSIYTFPLKVKKKGLREKEISTAGTRLVNSRHFCAKNRGLFIAGPG